ncbi:MAG: Ig-like domain-containing protein [Gemmatimonadota bacterium]
MYLAHEISLDRKVAIKVMAPQLMFGEGMAERFRREARTAASLSHPHIIPIYAVKESGRVLFFVMKFVAGRPLDDIVREVGPLPIPMVRAILSQVGGALGYAHRRGIIHRDIKPANIMIDDEGWSVVTDFGIAKVAETQGLTMTGVAVGTPSYMSPEQCAAKEVTGRSDQYSLGIVAYEMITGKQPFVADTAMAIMWQHFNDPPRPIRELRPDCPPELEAAVLRMLEKQPDKRWASIEDSTVAIGATPLSHDDPIRLQMVGLAKSSLNQRLLDEMKTPTSLVPPTRSSGKQGTEVIPGVGSVGVSPRSVNLAAGETIQLSVIVQDTRGDTVAGRAVKWSSERPAIATVSESGMATAVSPGEAVISAGCEGQTGGCQITVTPVPVSAVVVSPASGSIQAGATLQLSAATKDSQGKVITGREVTWGSSAPALAAVSATGLVTGAIAGSAKITATCEGRSGSANLTVTAAPMAGVKLDPSSLGLEVGQKGELKATVVDTAGKPMTRPVSWSSRNPAVATVAASGMVTGTGAGQADIVATCEGKSATVSVTVSPAPVAAVSVNPPALDLQAGASAPLVAVCKDARGQELQGRTVAWSSSKPSVATVTNGRVTAVGAGIAVVVATVEGKRATVDIKVTAVAAPPAPTPPAPAPPTPTLAAPARSPVQDLPTQRLPAHPSEPTVKVATPPPAPAPAVAARKTSRLPLILGVLAVLIGAGVWKFGPWGKVKGAGTGTAVALVAAPATQTMNVGDSVPMSGQFRDAQGNQVEGNGGVTWTSDNSGVAVVSGNYVKAVGGGTATVIGESQGLRGTAIMTVNGAPMAGRVAVATVALGPIARSLTDGESIQLAASTRDDKGTVLAGRPVSWTSSNPAVIEVSPTGLAIARSDGSATITATSEGKSATVDLTVAPAAVALVAVTPSRVSMEVGETVKLSGEARDARGNVLAQRPLTWTSSRDAVAKVGADGSVTGVAVGTATVTVASGGKRGTAAVTVVTTRVDVASITISPASGQLAVGEKVQLDAQLKDVRAAAIRDRTPSWVSSNTEVASVSPSGEVTAAGPGSATITASSDNQRATARIDVAAAAVGTLALTTPPSAIQVGEMFQLGGTVKDTHGGALLDRTISWTSSNQRVATVTSAGLITAVGPGTARITATVEGKTATVNLTVPAPVAVVTTVAIAPTSAAIGVGETVQLTAIPQDARGGAMERPVTWSSSNAGVASVSRAGLVSGIAAGSATISAVSDGKTATVAVTVAAKPGPDISGGNPPNPNTGGGSIARVSIVAGGTFSCGLVSGGSLACWGAGQSAPALLGDQRFSRLSAGPGHACGLTSTGEAWCWGTNSKGQLGDGTTNNTRATPVAVAGGLSFRVVRAGGTHSCALTGAGKGYCWGDNKDGQLGDGSNSGRTRPVPIPDLSFSDIAAGGNHSCGIATNGKTYCWGDGFSGQLGYGQLSKESSPTEVNTGAVKFNRIYAGGDHTCGLTAAGKAYCWGDNRAGQVGDGSGTDRTQPVEVQTTAAFEELSLGTGHTCGRTSGGAILCWGAGGKGQLGTGGRANQNKPVRVAGDGPFISVSAGVGHTCAATATQAFCWGDNLRGQLGDGTIIPKQAPTVVLGAN